MADFLRWTNNRNGRLPRVDKVGTVVLQQCRVLHESRSERERLHVDPDIGSAYTIRLVECKMPEQELNSTASKFISSLIKSLQIICNGHVDFNESIELIGHINVRIDSKFKYDYIVDEHVSKEGEDCSTTFLSNSYHSHPPPRATCIQSDHSQTEQDLSLSTLPAGSYKSQQSQSSRLGLPVNDGKKTEDSHRYNVNVDTQKTQDFQENQMVFKLEEDESNECMMLPTSADNYEPLDDVDDAKMKSSSSIGPECAEDSLGVGRTRKRQKLSGQAASEVSETQALKKRVMPNRKKTKFPKPTLVQTKPRKFANPEEIKRIDLLWSKSQDNYICSKCPYTTTYRNRVRAHCRSIHMGIPRKYKGNEKGYFVCDKCGKEFTSNRGFRMHMLSKHLNQFPYRCHECSKGFMSVSSHRDHMNMHAGVALQCLGCEALFYTEYGLKRHLLRKHPELL